MEALSSASASHWLPGWNTPETVFLHGTRKSEAGVEYGGQSDEEDVCEFWCWKKKSCCRKKRWIGSSGCGGHVI